MCLRFLKKWKESFTRSAGNKNPWNLSQISAVIHGRVWRIGFTSLTYTTRKLDKIHESIALRLVSRQHRTIIAKRREINEMTPPIPSTYCQEVLPSCCAEGGRTGLKSQRSKCREASATGDHGTEHWRGENCRQKIPEICRGVPLSLWLITPVHAWEEPARPGKQNHCKALDWTISRGPVGLGIFCVPTTVEKHRNTLCVG